MEPASGSSVRHATEVRWDQRIPVRDGLELSANLWLPVPRGDARDERFPALLEMIPYGKDNWRRNADTSRGEWFASRGFALCRLDVRGTGSSPGVALDEYTADETRDGYDAVEWLAAQPWCNGRVAMWGISYGGFTAIQVAKLRPPHLRAIVPFYATDDRYLDDVHYRGGCVTVSELSQYAVSQVAMNAMPPDIGFAGEGWRGAWRARLEATPIWLFRWLREQVDGPYWRQGSLAPEHDAIEAAILQVGGWNDSYVDPVFRMQERCVAPRRSIVGNWVHAWPDDAYPGPGFDWLREVVRFLDRWLRDVDDGVMEEAALTWFEREWASPEPFPASWPGRWRATSAYPHPALRIARWRLAGSALPGVGALVPDVGGGDAIAHGGDDPGRSAAEPDGSEAVDRLAHRATVGTCGALSWGAGSEPNGLARDLRPDEARSMTYTTEPLDAPLSVLGPPEAVLHVSSDMPVATVVCRLSDVAPDGTSALVSTGALNLTHRDSHATPARLEADRRYEVRVPLRTTGYRWATGHRIRLTVATQYWPVLWPSPYRGSLAVHRGAASPSRLELPVVPGAGGPGDAPVPAFRTERPALRTVGGGDDEPGRWRVVDDVLAGTVTVETYEGGTTVLEDGRSLFSSEALVMTASDEDPAHATFDSEVLYRWRPGPVDIDIRATATLRSDEDTFELAVDLEVDLDGGRFHERHERERIPRRLV